MAQNNHWLTSTLMKNILNLVFILVIAIITIYVMWIPIQQYSPVFSWHVILSTLSLIPLGLLAIVLFSSNNVWLQGIDRKRKALIHGWLMGLSLLLLIVGIAVEIDRGTKAENYPHFATAHSITGLICMILSIFAGLYGLCAKFSQSLKDVFRPVIIKFIHNVLGQGTLVFGIVSLCCGYYTNWFIFYTSVESRLIATIATTIICVWALYQAVVSAFNQFKSIVNK